MMFLYAILAGVILIVTSLSSLAMMWLVYGLWPISWGWWVLFMVVGFTCTLIGEIVKQSGRN